MTATTVKLGVVARRKLTTVTTTIATRQRQYYGQRRSVVASRLCVRSSGDPPGPGRPPARLASSLAVSRLLEQVLLMPVSVGWWSCCYFCLCDTSNRLTADVARAKFRLWVNGLNEKIRRYVATMGTVTVKSPQSWPANPTTAAESLCLTLVDGIYAARLCEKYTEERFVILFVWSCKKK